MRDRERGRRLLRELRDVPALGSDAHPAGGEGARSAFTAGWLTSAQQPPRRHPAVTGRWPSRCGRWTCPLSGPATRARRSCRAWRRCSRPRPSRSRSTTRSSLATCRSSSSRPAGTWDCPRSCATRAGSSTTTSSRCAACRTEWWNVTPPSVYLVPFGAPSGTYEQEVQINFRPPRSAEAEATALGRRGGRRLARPERGRRHDAREDRDHAVRAARERAAAARRHRPTPRRVRADGPQPRERAARHRDHRGRQRERADLRVCEAALHRRAGAPRRHDLQGQGEAHALDRPPDRPALRHRREGRHERDRDDAPDHRHLPAEAADPVLGADRSPRADRRRDPRLLVDPEEDDRALAAGAHRGGRAGAAPEIAPEGRDEPSARSPQQAHRARSRRLADPEGRARTSRTTPSSRSRSPSRSCRTCSARTSRRRS